MRHLFDYTYEGSGTVIPDLLVNTNLQSMTSRITMQLPADNVPSDIFSRLGADRIIYIGTPIDNNLANVICGQLLYLSSIDQEKEITLWINSPGGDVAAGLAIYDVMKFIHPDVATVCIGTAASMAAVLLCAGAKGRRAILPHGRVMIHQPLGEVRGPAADMAIVMREVERRKEELYGIIAEHTGQRLENLKTDADRDFWMTAKEALSYGMVDTIVERQAFHGGNK